LSKSEYGTYGVEAIGQRRCRNRDAQLQARCNDLPFELVRVPTRTLALGLPDRWHLADSKNPRQQPLGRCPKPRTRREAAGVG